MRNEGGLRKLNKGSDAERYGRHTQRANVQQGERSRASLTLLAHPNFVSCGSIRMIFPTTESLERRATKWLKRLRLQVANDASGFILGPFQK